MCRTSVTATKRRTSRPKKRWELSLSDFGWPGKLLFNVFAFHTTSKAGRWPASQMNCAQKARKKQKLSHGSVIAQRGELSPTGRISTCNIQLRADFLSWKLDSFPIAFTASNSPAASLVASSGSLSSRITTESCKHFLPPRPPGKGLAPPKLLLRQL